MSDFTWLAEARELQPAALTVRAQTISPNDTGRLFWDAFFPRVPANSVRLDDILTLDYRPVADRREWNLRGRYIPMQTPPRRTIEMVPIEAYDKIAEREMQMLMERSFGNDEIIRRIIGASIPQRTDKLVQADYRRIEVDAFSAWALGQITVMDPGTGQSQTVSLEFDTARYDTAATAWNDGGVNGWDEFIAWLEDGIDSIGPIAGAVMRLATFKAIQADAPQGVNAVVLTREQVRQRVEDELGAAFTFYILEHHVDVFDDAGIAHTATKVWPAQQVAAVPVGERVGNTHFAPVARAMELSAQVPEAGIDVRGVTVYHETENGGRALAIEAQVNALPLPDEQKLWVIDAGV